MYTVYSALSQTYMSVNCAILHKNGLKNKYYITEQQIFLTRDFVR